jgi:hypothetical protein
MPARAARAAGARAALQALGWNIAHSHESTDGVTVTLYEFPYRLIQPGIRVLRLNGPSEHRAIADFLDQAILVRVVSRDGDESVRLNRGVVSIHVEPVTPLPAEEGDIWTIFRRGSAAIPYELAVGTNRTFSISRREARLANADEAGHRILRPS